MCKYVLAACMCNHLHAWCPQKLEEGIRSLELELQIAGSHADAMSSASALSALSH